MNEPTTARDPDAVRQIVRSGYSKIGRRTSSAGCGISRCGSSFQDSDKLARELGCSAAELNALPDGVLKMVEPRL